MLRRNECRLNVKNRPVRTGDLKGGLKQLPPPPATNRGSQEPATNRVKAIQKFSKAILNRFRKTVVYMSVQNTLRNLACPNYVTRAKNII